MGELSSKRYAVCSASIAGMQTSRHTVFLCPGAGGGGIDAEHGREDEAGLASEQA